MTHDWRHTIGRIKYSEPVKKSLRRLLSETNKISDKQQKLAALIIVFVVLHERIQKAQPTFHKEDLLADLEKITAAVNNGSYGARAKNHLRNFSNESWALACQWIAETFSDTSLK